jgi:AcrR family transcriptional regulator
LGDAALDAARHYFGTHGLRCTALDDIARSSDLDLRELSRRYPSPRTLAVGVFERMLDILGAQLEQQDTRGATLTERLQSWFELELQLLEPCKALVRSWLIDSSDPLSPAALLQGPLAFRYVAQIQREIELARGRGEVSGWTLSSVAAGAFVGLRRSLVLSWLGDASPAAERTLAFARAEIAAFVRLLAPWPGLEDARPSARPRSAPEPRALATANEAVDPSSSARALPVATTSLAQESAAAAVQTSAVPAEAAATAAVNAAVAQAPAILGILAQTPPAPEPLGSETSTPRAQRRARAKRPKH